MLRKYLSLTFLSPILDQMKIADWLRLFLLILAALIVVMGFILPLWVNPQLLRIDFFLINLVSLAVIGGALILVHYGYVRIAAMLSIIFLFGAVTYTNINVFGNIRNPNLMAYFVLIPLAGLVLGKRFMFYLTLLCIGAIGLIMYLEVSSAIPVYLKAQSTWDDMWAWFLALALNTVLLAATLRRSEVSAQTAQNALTTLLSVNQELQNSQVQLRQAYEREKELSELKSRFVSMASHEFRTPLTTILLSTETLLTYRRKLTDTQIEQRLSKIQEQVEYLKGITEDVLQLTKFQARRLEFRPDWLDLQELCCTIISELQSQSDGMHRLQYRSDDFLPLVYADKRLIRQIINNLVSNAIKYSPADKPVVFKLTQTDEGVAVIVSDEGIGIPAADMKYLFEPFHRAANVGAIAGTGLGLVIAKEAVELHNGMITVTSEVNQGTTFVVKLPLPIEEKSTYVKRFAP